MVPHATSAWSTSCTVHPTNIYRTHTVYHQQWTSPSSHHPHRDVVQEYVDWVNENISITGVVEVNRGRNGLPFVQLTHPQNNSTAQIYLHGACVTSWRKPNGTEMLHIRDDGRWNPTRPIFGGIPICFPQYRRGELAGQGFLQHVHWDVADAYVDDPDFHSDPAPTVVLHAESDEHTMQAWPYKFKAYYSISLADGVDEDPLVPDANEDDAEEAALHGKVPEGWDVLGKVEEEEGYELVRWTMSAEMVDMWRHGWRNTRTNTTW